MMNQAVSQQIDHLCMDHAMLLAQMNSMTADDPARVTLSNLAKRTQKRIAWLCEQENPDDFYLGASRKEDPLHPAS